MEKRYLLGNEAIAHACLESSVDFVTGYPGTPSSEVIDTLRSAGPSDFYLEWSVNEKVAFENALAAAWCGQRALCTMKHVGLNVASDPLMTSAYTGITGGFVVMSADDPFAHSSQNEQDSRCYARFARLPCLDPPGVQEAHDMMRDAFSLSEELGLPVIFRPTTRICHSKSDVVLGKTESNHRKGKFVRDPAKYVVIPAHTRVLHRKLNEKQPIVVKTLGQRGYNTAVVRGKIGVIAGGISASYIQEVIPPDISWARVGAYPIDEGWLRNFVRKHREILVIEELHPIIEEAVREISGKIAVHGKKDGFTPWEGELNPASVAEILVNAGYLSSSPFRKPVPADTTLPPRPPILCAGCMHRATFYAIKKVFPNAVYPSDIGCYTLGLQLGVVDTTICMGASITIASGIVHSGDERDIVCTIGDSTFLHSGICGLLNAVYNGAEMTVVILDNRITAMTGHQPNPVSGKRARGESSVPISLEAICRACGVQYVETADPYDLADLTEALRRSRDQKGVRVIIAKQPCVISARRAGVKRKPFAVDAELCTGCSACIRFGCPAIELREEKSSIGPLCSGCGVCASICPAGAIGPGGRP